MTEIPNALDGAFGSLVEAIDNNASDSVGFFLDELLVITSGQPDPPSVVMEMAEILVDAWLDAEDLWPDDDAATTMSRRVLIIEVLTSLGDKFPMPIFAGAYHQQALRFLGEDDERAITSARSAVALAESPKEAAEYQLCLALAAVDLTRYEEAVSAAEAAVAHAQDDRTRQDAFEVLIPCLLELGRSEAAADRALALLEAQKDLSAGLREQIVRAVVARGADFDASGHAPLRLRRALRTFVSQPGWVSPGFSVAELAVAVAWTEFMADDLAAMSEILRLCDSNDIADPELQGRAGLLRVMDGWERFDPIVTDRALREAATAIERSGSAELKQTYRVIVKMIEGYRGGEPELLIPELEGPAQRSIDSMRSFRLMTEGYQRILNDNVGPDLHQRLEAWAANPPAGDALTRTTMLVLAATVAGLSHDCDAARRHLDAAGRVLESLEPGSLLVDPLRWEVDYTRAALMFPKDPTGAVQAFEALIERSDTQDMTQLGAIAKAALAAALVRSEPRRALSLSVEALIVQRRTMLALAASSERISMEHNLARMYATALDAAAQLNDPYLQAELLEFLRSQDLPIIHTCPENTQLPFSMLLPPRDGSLGLSTTRARAVLVRDAVKLEDPAPVMMPWSRVALGTDRFTIGDLKAPVPLTIPL